MSIDQEPEDKTLAALGQMIQEFGAHKQRLATRAKQVAEKLTAGEIADVPSLGAVVVEIFQELHDTSLSFQSELTELIHAELLEQAAGIDDDEDDDLLDDEDGPTDDDPSQLLPGDAAQLRRSTTEYIAILDAMLDPQNPYDPAARKNLAQKKTDAEESLALINSIELRDAADAVEEEDDGPASTQPS